MRFATGAALLISLILSGSSPLLAESDNQPTSGTKYDRKTGNRYNWSTDSQGETTVKGRNTQTGSTWKTVVEQDGDMRGRDADGNSWKYNATTDRYYNSGTGETRTGKGRNRRSY